MYYRMVLHWSCGWCSNRIKPKEAEDEELAALKAENESLKTQLAESQSKVTDSVALVEGYLSRI